jgi:hypothetical protein
MSATNRGSTRRPNDYYMTPDYTIESLLQVLDLSSIESFLEPCRGSGAIYNKISAQRKEYAEILENKDYLKTIFNSKFDLIITNPPFSLAQEFIEKSSYEAHSIWYLLRLNFLGSKKRSGWWLGKEPTHLLTLSARPSFTNNGSTDATEYAWYGWDFSGICKLSPGIHVLDYLKY